MVGASAPFAPPVCVAKSGDAGRRGIEVVVVVGRANGWHACMRGEVGWVLVCHGRVQQACVEGGRVSCTIKNEGEKKGGCLIWGFFRCDRNSEGDGSGVACGCPRR